MDAIVYTSNTGYTKQYAELLAQRTGLKAYDLKEAKGAVKDGADIFYLGWLMAGGVKGYKKANKRYNVKSLIAVGMAQSEEQIIGIRKKYALPETMPVYNLQGGFDINKLHGIYKFMMKTMIKNVGGKLSAKTDRTPSEDDMLDLMVNGGNRVKSESLDPVLEWYNANK